MTAVKKAVLPVAGLGTRFLPATKAMPKEMLTVVDKPLIQYAVEEALAAGVEEFCFVTGRGKSALENHFDQPYELADILRKKGKTKELEAVMHILPEHCRITYTRQGEPKGLGHAINCARNFVNDDPFMVLLPDDLIWGEPNPMVEMAKLFEKEQRSVVLTMDVPRERTRNYGVVDLFGQEQPGPGGHVKARGFVEKPDPEDAPSSLAVVGRYILTPDIFDLLGEEKVGHGGEIQLTDAMHIMAQEHPFMAHVLSGERFDCGDKVGFQQANLFFALSDPYIATRLAPFVARMAAATRTLLDESDAA